MSQVGCSGVTGLRSSARLWAAQASGRVVTSWLGLSRGFSRRRARRASWSEDLRGRRSRRGSGGKACGLLDVDGRIGGFGEDERHRLGGEVAALHEPLVVLL